MSYESPNSIRRGATWLRWVAAAVLLVAGGAAFVIYQFPGLFWPHVERWLGTARAITPSPLPAASVPTGSASVAKSATDHLDPLLSWLPWLLLVVVAARAWRWLFGVNSEQNQATLGRVLDRLKPHARSMQISAEQSGLVGMAILAALLVSFVSFYTTFKGALVFFGTQPDQFAMALALALGIQVTCYLASWFVAEELVANDRARADDDLDRPTGWFVFRHFGKVTTLLVCVFASIFFSFAAHFENVYGGKRLALANLQNARADTTAVFSGTEKAIIAERDDVSAQLSAGRPWREFSQKLADMLVLAENNPQAVQQQIRARRAAAENDIGKTRSELETRRRELAAAQGEIDRLRALGGAPAAPASGQNDAQGLATLRGEVGRLESLRVDYDAALKIELSGNRPENVPDACRTLANQQAQQANNAGRTRAGSGPVSRCIQKELNDVQVRLQSKRTELARLTGESERRLTANASRDEQIRQLDARRFTVAGQIAGLEARMKEEQAALDGVEGSPDFAQAASGAENSKRLKAERDSFLRTGSKTSFDTMIAGCATLQEVLRSTPSTANQVPVGVCDASAFTAAVDRMSTLDKALADFRVNCAIDAAFNALPFAMAYVDKANSCLALAKVPDRLTRQKDTIDQIAQLNHPDASNFERSMGALSRGDRLAWLSMALAIAVDLIVFLSAVLGSRSDMSPLLRGPDIGGVFSSEDVKDIRAGAADTMQYGDEPREIAVYKRFCQAARMSRRDEQSDTRWRIDLSELEAADADDLRPTLAVLVVKGKARAVPGDHEIFEIEPEVSIDFFRQIRDYETARERREGKRTKPRIVRRPTPRQPDAEDMVFLGFDNASAEPPIQPFRSAGAARQSTGTAGSQPSSATMSVSPVTLAPAASNPATMGEYPKPAAEPPLSNITSFPGSRAGYT